MKTQNFNLHVEHESLRQVDECSTSSKFEHVGQNKSIINH